MARGAQDSTPRALAELKAETEAEVEDVDVAGRGRAVAAAARGLLAAETMGAAAAAAVAAAAAAAEEQRWLRLEAETHDKALREELDGEVDRLEQLRNEADSAAEAVVEVEAQLVDSYAEGQAVVAQADAAWHRTSSKRVGLLADAAERVASARVVAAREVSSLLQHDEAGVAAVEAELELEVGGDQPRPPFFHAFSHSRLHKLCESCEVNYSQI